MACSNWSLGHLRSNLRRRILRQIILHHWLPNSHALSVWLGWVIVLILQEAILWLTLRLAVSRLSIAAKWLLLSHCIVRLIIPALVLLTTIEACLLTWLLEIIAEAYLTEVAFSVDLGLVESLSKCCISKAAYYKLVATKCEHKPEENDIERIVF